MLLYCLHVLFLVAAMQYSRRQVRSFPLLLGVIATILLPL